MDVQQKLIERCIKKDRKAEFELYRACYSYLLSICRRYIRQHEKAQELLNMGFYRIISNLEKYEPRAPFGAWARRIMINTLINEYKKEKIHYGNHQYVEEYYDSNGYAAINEAVTRYDTERIYQLIGKLPPATQQVFNLYFIDGFRHAEIAALLKISEGTSKWHINAAREKLKQMLTEQKVEMTIEK
jgi:RNA polymerase sigma factor (sigma-70 family)